MTLTWIEWLLWIGVVGGVVSALWAAVYLKAQRMQWILGDLTLAALALFSLFRKSMPEVASNILLVLLLAWMTMLIVMNRRTRAKTNHAAE